MKHLRITLLYMMTGIIAAAVVLLLARTPLEERQHNHSNWSHDPDHYIKSESASDTACIKNTHFVHLCTSAQEFYDSLTFHIDNAQESIYMDMYEFRNDSIGRQIMSHLHASASRGVEVTLELDGFGTPEDEWKSEEVPSTEEAAMNASDGITIKSIDPVKFPYLNHLMCRDHRKVVIIDGKWNSIGCTNIANYYIKGLPEVGNWNDMTLTFSAGNPSVTVLETKEEYTKALEELLDNATDNIQIIQPYIALPSPLEGKIFKAIAKGVKVEFLIGEKGDIASYLASAMGFLHKAQQAGAKVWIYRPGFHHTKAVCADGERLFIGSVNFTCRSFRRNVEEAAIAEDKQAAEEFNCRFNDFKTESVPLDEAYWSALPLLKRAKYSLYYRFRYLIAD